MACMGSTSADSNGLVFAHVSAARDHASEHERRTLLGFAQRLAALLGFTPCGFHDTEQRPAGRAYFVPCSTLTTQEAAALGIAGPGDLFGGVVPHAFVATKAIGHPLVRPGARSVGGWSDDFPRQVRDAVLAGFTVFDRADAHAAAEHLVAAGPVRVKPVRASGGHGQSVARDAASLHALLDTVDEAELRAHGLVLEEDLQELRTFSIGQVRVADLLASYFGVQRTTPDNEGKLVFGGSDLTIVRGDFAELRGLQPEPAVAHALQQASRYDAAVHACFPGFYASRSNYDVLLGRDASGRMRSAVLEQSWRAGGATGAEIAALEAFRADPQRRHVRASTFEVFGDGAPPPPEATVYFRGIDPAQGALTKYTLVHA